MSANEHTVYEAKRRADQYANALANAHDAPREGEGRASCNTYARTADRALLLRPAAGITPETAGTRGRFWIIVRDPGCVPDRKGPWPSDTMAKTLREFMDARPTSFLTVLTVSEDGCPSVQDGPECLMMLDGRSMSRASKHIQTSKRALPQVDSDLLDVVVRLEWWLSVHPDGAVMRDVCRAAISNATGAQQEVSHD